MIIKSVLAESERYTDCYMCVVHATLSDELQLHPYSLFYIHKVYKCGRPGSCKCLDHDLGTLHNATAMALIIKPVCWDNVCFRNSNSMHISFEVRM